MEEWERFVALEQPGLYESNYLKANAPDGRRALWLKHNILHPPAGAGRAELELWLVVFERGVAPRVWKRVAPLEDFQVAAGRLALDGQGASFTTTAVEGRIGSASWSLRLSDALPCLPHFPYRWMYTGPFPKKKALTPGPDLRFDGVLMLGDSKWSLEGWRGLRGHNWGREHAHAYAYGNCSLWNEPEAGRLHVDGFTARIRLGPMLSPWLTAVVGHVDGQSQDWNRPSSWLGSGTVDATHWSAKLGGTKTRGNLSMEADPTTYVGLRYHHPDGREAYCYNTKWAETRLQLQGREDGPLECTSGHGELEVLFHEPLPDIPLHPSADWDAGAGPYEG